MRALALLLAMVPLMACSAAAESEICSGKGPYIHVKTAEHRMWLCEGGVTDGSYNVRLGKNGVGKKREGDGKTPLGTYRMGPPRNSQRYGTFIPIEYPTAEQRARGYTGSSVGVHGPIRDFKWLGRLVNLFDTTDGCVGLATDAEMSKIAEWARRTKAAQIVLE